MSEVWNLWETDPPPVCTVKSSLQHKEISNLNSVLFEILNSLKKMKCLDSESVILSKLLYKYKRPFRHDKGMQNLVQLYQCLKRYLKLNFYDTVDTFKQSIPSKLRPTATHAYLPTKQMLKWVLLRLQAFSQIFKRIFNLSNSVASYVYQKLPLGWSLNLSFVIFSIVARIWACAKYLLLKCIEWYSSLYRFLPCLKSTVEYLSDYEFPTDLKKWLDVDLSPPKIKTSIDKVFEMIDLVRDEEEDKDEDDEVKIISEKFIKSLFNLGVMETNSDLKEIKPKKETKTVEERGVKRHQAAMQYEDLGIPVVDEDDDDDEEIVEIPVKKAKKKNRLRRKRRRALIDESILEIGK